METSIEWTATRLPDGRVFPGFTFNPWWVCAEVSEACDNCYARVWARRYGWEWGTDAPRRFFGDHHWKEPLKWNRKAQELGVQLKVFCASMADVFEILPVGHADREKLDEARVRLWALIEATPHLDWLLLTKRPKNIERCVPSAWMRDGFPANIWAGTTAETQEWARKRVPHLLEIPAQVLFLSMEPLLGAVDLTDIGGPGVQHDCLTGEYSDARTKTNTRTVSWVITGGESGHGARLTHPDWFRSICNQCDLTGVAYFHKQNGNWEPFYDRDVDDPDWRNVPQEAPGIDRMNLAGGQGFHGDRVVYFRNVGKKAAGRLLDGIEHNGMPEVAR